MRILSSSFSSLCNEYLREFCYRHKYDLGEFDKNYDYAEINGNMVAFDVIRYDVDFKVPVGTYEQYINHLADAAGFISYPTYIQLYQKQPPNFCQYTELINAVCLEMEIDAATLLGKTRKADVTLIRHCLAYHWRKQGLNLNAISILLGRTNHSTIINSVLKIEDMVAIKDKRTLRILEVVNNA